MEIERGVFLNYLVKASNYFWFYIVLKIFSSILGSPNNMIVMLIGAVIKGSDSHGYSIARL